MMHKPFKAGTSKVDQERSQYFYIFTTDPGDHQPRLDAVTEFASKKSHHNRNHFARLDRIKGIEPFKEMTWTSSNKEEAKISAQKDIEVMKDNIKRGKQFHGELPRYKSPFIIYLSIADYIHFRKGKKNKDEAIAYVFIMIEESITSVQYVNSSQGYKLPTKIFKAARRKGYIDYSNRFLNTYYNTNRKEMVLEGLMGILSDNLTGDEKFGYGNRKYNWNWRRLLRTPLRPMPSIEIEILKPAEESEMRKLSVESEIGKPPTESDMKNSYIRFIASTYEFKYVSAYASAVRKYAEAIAPGANLILETYGFEFETGGPTLGIKRGEHLISCTKEMIQKKDADKTASRSVGSEKLRLISSIEETIQKKATDPTASRTAGSEELFDTNNQSFEGLTIFISFTDCFKTIIHEGKKKHLVSQCVIEDKAGRIPMTSFSFGYKIHENDYNKALKQGFLDNIDMYLKEYEMGRHEMALQGLLAKLDSPEKYYQRLLDKK